MSARGPHHQLRPDPLATAPDRFVPVPAEVIHPHVGAHALLTASPVRRASSAADLAPPALRPGSEDFLACPSRIGNRLHYRGGRVTDLRGNPIFSPQEPQA